MINNMILQTRGSDTIIGEKAYCKNLIQSLSVPHYTIVKHYNQHFTTIILSNILNSSIHIHNR